MGCEEGEVGGWFGHFVLGGIRLGDVGGIGLDWVDGGVVNE